MTSVSTVHRSSFTFSSDIAPSRREAHRSGILHATKFTDERGHRREEHTFAWLADRGRDHAARVVAHLGRFGFEAERAVFLPYSSQETWVSCYPHACPYIGCDGDGKITGVTEGVIVPSSPDARPKKRRKAGKSVAPSKLLPAGNLSDLERAQLHLEIYHYFTWLQAQLAEVEEKGGGNKIARGGISMPGMQNLLSKLEGTFRTVKEFKRKQSDDGEAAIIVRAAIDATGTGDDHVGDLAGGGTATFEGEREAPAATRRPLLETTMAGDLRLIVEETQPATGSTTAAPARAVVDFDALCGLLAAFREQHGHARVPHGHGGATKPALGHWVSGLRARRKQLRARGQAAEPPAPSGATDFPVPPGRLGLALRFDGAGPGGAVTAVEPGGACRDRVAAGDRLVTVDGVAVTKAEDLEAGREKAVRILGFSMRPTESVYHLSTERLARLDALDFVWEVTRNIKSWDERFELLKQYKATHEKWPGRTVAWEGVGTWIHGQRRACAKKDPYFMAHRKHRLEEIGFPLRDENRAAIVTWEDHCQRLVEFGRVNRHFNVPCPEGNSKEGAKVSAELRFYRWVQSVHATYPAYLAGKKSMLNEDRVKQLEDLGFEFCSTFGRSPGTQTARMQAQINDIPFEKRLLQLGHFREEFGHMDIDHRYSKMDNIGGWAVDISKRYANWQDGKEELAPVDDHQLGQLRALGFKFDVIAVPRSKRSWQESFEAFLEFQIRYGHSNVPYNCKVDIRLGVWARTQRDHYRFLKEGKPSRLTKDRIERLKNAGFPWEYWVPTSMRK